MIVIAPFIAPHFEYYQALLQAIPDSGMILKAPLMLPYKESPTSFFLKATAGDTIEITINEKLVKKLILGSDKEEVLLQLIEGRNYIQATNQDGEVARIFVVSTNECTLLMGWAEQFFNEIGVRMQHYWRQLHSSFSLMQVEHQIVWQDLLPSTRAMRILAGKMAVKSLVNMAATDGGVMDIATAITGNTPIVVPTEG